MKDYTHTVHYYETDRMGITHHSNYVRWMEEARIDFLRQIGWNYEKLESLGIISPVTAINCRYKASTTFSDEVSIAVSVEEFKGVRLKLRYVMRKQSGECVFEGASEHCFVDRNGKLIKLNREYPDFYHTLTALGGRDDTKNF